MKAYHLLSRLEKIRANYGEEHAVEKARLLKLLDRRRLTTARQVQRLHDALNFLYAYPDNRVVFNLAKGMLSGFSDRSDLKKYKLELISSGIAGTDIQFQFFWPMAKWLAENWPDYLNILWDELEEPEKLLKILPFLISPSESGTLDELDLVPKTWINLLKKDTESDAAFLVTRLKHAYTSDQQCEAVHDDIDLNYHLRAGPTTPNISNAILKSRKIYYQKSPFEKKRPDINRVIKDIAFRHNKTSQKTGQTLISLARKTMLTHERDLDAFSYGDPSDVKLVNFGDGHQIACNSMVPDRRYLLHSTYGCLNIKNGMPIGYFQIINLYQTAEIAFNLFAPFRGGEAARTFARNLAMAHQLFDINTFILDPYQLGHGNQEGLESGVWWFYYKLGFRPLDNQVLSLAKKEIHKITTRPGYRTGLHVLDKMASENMYFNIDNNITHSHNFDNISYIPLGISRYMASRFGAEREQGTENCVRKALKLTLTNSAIQNKYDQQAMWERWAPLLLNIRGINGWSGSERNKIGKIINAKAGSDEQQYVKMLNSHQRLKKGILDFARRTEGLF